jgi:tRNA (guanosine-2'-O-)-methyltransferase
MMKQQLIPHGPRFQVGKMNFEASEILDLLSEYLTEQRKEKMAQVIDDRTYHVTPVLDGVYDLGNVNAVMRTSEALGFQSLHVIQTESKFRVANRIAKGTDKWLDVKKWKTHAECLQFLKEKGYRIYATHVDEKATPLAELDFISRPVALVFGNEGEGVSKEILETADERCYIPMAGFVESFNISVAAALSLYHIRQDRIKQLGKNGDLTDEEKKWLLAAYTVRNVRPAEKILERLRGI